MKRALLYFSISAICLAMVACSAPEEESSTDGGANESESATGADEEVELEMYSWRSEDRSAYETIIEAFEEEHPNISISFRPFDSSEYNTILTNALVSGSGPDIVQLRPYSGAETIADNGYLVNLDDIEGLDNINDDYLNAARGSDESLYGIPLSLNAGVIFYNQDLFDEYGVDVPGTYEEFVAASETFLENDIVPVAQGGRLAYLLSMLHGVMSPSVYGGNEFVEEVTSGEADLTDERLLSSLERMEELERFFPQDFIALDDNDAQAIFYAEEAAMYINGDYRIGTFESNIPDMNLGVIPGLQLDEGGETPVMTWVDGSYGVVDGTGNEEAALKFMEFMATPEFGQLFTDNLNRVSAVDGVNPEHDLVQQIAQAAEESSTPYLMLVHFGTGSPTTKTVFEDSLQGMYLDEITKEDVLEDSQQNAERAEEEEPEDLDE
ncbi:ABC transporter substrate-binding protein [Alteribacter aurantiacus]|uniref:ABC transporter substrate-binding protein n=1 Tax=Alteribacter aurantiacus TaxID=254410 RepID=UPI00040CB232|nr:extracellular solute-binding protein [Alteribacter aurantiacus]